MKFYLILPSRIFRDVVLSRQTGCKRNFSRLMSDVDTVSQQYKTRFDANQLLLSQYNDFMTKARAGGGARAIQRHVEVNKKVVVRRRLEMLLDPGSYFFEIGALAGMNMDYGDVPAAGTVVGIGIVSGHRCMVVANDATVKGGTIYPIAVKKQLRAQEVAQQLRLPTIQVVDSGGAYLPLQAEIFPDAQHGGRVFYNEAVMGADGIAQIAVVCGSCTAGAAYIPTLADDSVIVHERGSLFLAGPPLVKAATGEIVSSEELGGATVHCKTSGCTDYFAATEQDAFSMCRDIVCTLNLAGNCHERVSPSREPLYSSAELSGLAGTVNGGQTFLYNVLARIFDSSQFYEFKSLYGSALLTGYGKLDGYLVGVVASCGTAFDSASCLKACQFVQMCDERDIPLLFLQNTQHSGWEHASTKDYDVLKSTAGLIGAISCARVPKITLNIGNCFGYENWALCGKSIGPMFTLAWPNAQTCFVNPSTEVIYAYDGNSSEVDQTEWKDVGVKMKNESSAFHAASRLWVDAIVVPSETRDVLKHLFAICRLNFHRRLRHGEFGERSVIRM